MNFKNDTYLKKHLCGKCNESYTACNLINGAYSVVDGSGMSVLVKFISAEEYVSYIYAGVA